MKKNDNYNLQVSLQKGNKENKGSVINQNQLHNSKKEALGPNTRRNTK